MQKTDEDFMREAIKLSIERQKENDGGPFGCVITKDNEIIARGWNHVTSDNDPTAHGEIVAIRNACKSLDDFDLTGCKMYTSSEPCPMCMAAIYWSNISELFYGNSIKDAEIIGFRDVVLYDELNKTNSEKRIPVHQILNDEAIKAFELWSEKTDKTMY